MTIAYRSKVLRCNVNDDDCPICRFLNGDLTTATMLRVISVLDGELASEEIMTRNLMTQLVRQKNQQDDP